MTSKNSKNSKKLNDFMKGVSLPEGMNKKIITGLSLDSRRVKKGDIFFALKGSSQDGNKYIDEAITNGAKLVFTDQKENIRNSKVFYHPKLRQNLGLIASSFYDEPSKKLDIFCATGTNGKTTYVETLSKISQRISLKTGYISTINSCINGKKIEISNLTTPDPITIQQTLGLMVDNNCSIVSLEASSHGISQKRMVGTKIKVAVLTSFSQDHLDYHKTIERYAKTKRSLFTEHDVESCLINIDSDFGLSLYQDLEKLHKKVYSISFQKEANFKISFLATGSRKIKVRLDSDFGQMRFYVSTFSQTMASNIILAVCSLLITGEPIDLLEKSVEEISLPEGRMDLMEIGLLNNCIIDFAHTPEALENCLKEIRKNFEGNLWCIFGCGGDRDKTKRKEMGKIAERYSDKIILTNDNPRFESPKKILDDILTGIISKKVHIEEDRKKAIEYALKLIHSSKTKNNLLIAGKGHERYQEIDGEHFEFNDKEVVTKIFENL